MTRQLRHIAGGGAVFALVVLAGTSCRSPQSADPSRPSSPLPPIYCRPERPAAEQPAADARKRFCVIDVGSRNVKFVVASTEGREVPSLRDEHQCYARLRLGEKILDTKTKFPLMLQDLDTEALIRIMTQYVQRCDAHGGKMLGAIASEWARKAKNPEHIQTQVKERTGVALEILAREREGRYGYLAAARGAPGRIVLDMGSRSLQLAYWPKGARGPESVSLPLGIDEASGRFFAGASPKEYDGARKAFIDALMPDLGPTLQRIREEVGKGTLASEIVSLGENGDILFALQGQLWDTGAGAGAGAHKGLDEAGYMALVHAFAPTRADNQGFVTGNVKASDLASLIAKLEKDADLVALLKSESVKHIYGSKILVWPALVSMLAKELSVDTVVLVPQEMPDGLIIDSLPTVAL